MRTAISLLAVILCLGTGGSDYFEARRVLGQTERELDVRFSSEPTLLLTESYGWAEEGGDRSLFQLNPADCLLVRGRLGTAVGSVSDESRRLFALARVKPAQVRRQSRTDQQGDTRVYELDEASCVLLRQAHFE